MFTVLTNFLLCRKSSNGKQTENVEWRRLRQFATTSDIVALIVGCICSAIGGILQNMVLFLGGKKPSDPELLSGALFYLICLAASGVGELIATFIEMYCFAHFVDNLVRRLRKDYMSAVTHKDTTWWEQTEPGAVTLQLNENIETVRDGLGSKLGMLIRGFSMYVSSIVFCLIVSWQLTLILVPIGPLTALTLGLSDKVNTKYSKKLGDMEEKAASTLEEVLLNVKTVQLCNAQEHFVKKYLELLHASLSSNLKSSTWIGVIEGFVLFQTAFLMALFLWTSMTMFFNASIAIAPGDILLILNTMTMSAYCFSLLGPHFSAVSKGRIAATAICEIIDNTPVSGTKSKPLENIKGHICFSNVRFKYSTREEEILRGLSWTAEPGQSIALVGESGCGKSTSLQILTRMYDASSDNVSIDGVDIKNICPSSLRKVTGVVEQRSCLITGTIAENIRFGRENVSDEEVKNAATMANAHEFIASMEKGYDTIVGDGGIMLSGGQKQRVAIARAILCNPKILLLDEATSALDTKSEKVVQEALNKASEGRTTVIVAHRLSTLKTVDRIFVLEKGVVTESGSHTELIEKDGYYARMVRAQDVDEGEDDYEKEDEKESEKSRLTERPVTLRRSRRSLRRPVDAEEMRLPAEEFEWNGQFATLFWKSLAGNYAKSIGSALLAFIRGLDIPTITLGYYFTFLALQKSSDTYQHYMWFAVGLVAGDGIVLFFVNTAMMLDSTMGINFGGFVAVFVGLIISVIFVWEISVLATVLCCLAYIVFFAILHWSNVARHQKAKGERSAQMALEITENVRSVKIFAVEDYFVNRYGQELLIARKFERRIAFIEALNMSMTQSFIFLADLAFYSYASYLVYYGYYDIDTVFLSFLGAQLSGWAVVMTAPFFPDMIRALGSVKTIFKYIDDPHDIAKRLTSGETPEVNGAISFENVSFAYPSKRDVLVTKNMNFKSKSGEKIAFVGPSGGGKSTVLNLLTKLYSPTSGAVQIGDHDLNKISTMHFRRNLGVVGQEPVLFKGTILENITMGDETITLEMVKSACQTANAMKFINNLPENFETDVGDHGQRLSGGQRQRIAIARAIVRKPKVLLLDEATAALDAENEELVNQALAAATEHTTSITIAHRLKTIQQCDYIYFVEHGKVTESGTHKELMQGDGHYAALVNAQKLK